MRSEEQNPEMGFLQCPQCAAVFEQRVERCNKCGYQPDDLEILKSVIASNLGQPVARETDWLRSGLAVLAQAAENPSLSPEDLGWLEVALVETPKYVKDDDAALVLRYQQSGVLLSTEERARAEEVMERVVAAQDHLRNWIEENAASEISGKVLLHAPIAMHGRTQELRKWADDWNEHKETQMLGFPAIMAWPVGAIAALLTIGASSLVAPTCLFVGWFFSGYIGYVTGPMADYVGRRVGEESPWHLRVLMPIIFGVPFLVPFLLVYLIRLLGW